MNKLVCSILFLFLSLSASAQLQIMQTTSASAAGYPMAAAFPAAPAAGDLLVALVGYYSSDSVTPPFGWKLLQQQYGNGAGGTTAFTSFYHFVGAAEANSYTFDQGGNAATLTLFDITGADTFHPFNSFIGDAQKTPTPSVITPPVTPTVTGTLPIAAIADEGSQPAGTLSPRWTYKASASPRHPVGAAYGPLTTDTSTPVTPQFALTTPDSYGLAALTVLVNPAGTTGHTPSAVVGGPYMGVTGIAINFDGSASSDPRYEALTYAWVFGDGSTGTGIQANHTYLSTGSYPVTLTVTDTDGNIAKASTTVSITPDCSGVSLGAFGALNNFVPSPNDAWHQDVSGASVDPMSDTILVTNRYDLAGSYLHPDFGANGAYGIPYTVVDSASTPHVPLAVTEYPDESDVAFFPIPSDMPVEGSPDDCASNGDNHAIVFDKHSCVVHEMYHTQSCSTASSRWSAGASTMWDLTLVEKRPYGITSVDAAGLSVFEGLVRYDEIVAGTINHAIRFTAQHTKNNSNNGYFTYPATHSAGDYGNGIDNIEGMRIRLKAGYDISRLTPQAKIIATAMKKYGMILADNGSNLFFQGTPDKRWSDDDLNTLKSIPASAFEVINASLSSTYTPGVAPLFPKGNIYDAVNHPTGTAPTISSFTASAASIYTGGTVTLAAAVLGSSYTYIDKVGFVRGSVAVQPSATTTYTLTARNEFGTSTATTTVTVLAAKPSPTLAFVVADKTYGAAPFTVAASSNSPGAITYAVVSGPAGIAGNVVTVTGVGTVTLQATQASTESFAAAATQATFLVNPVAPVLALVPIANQTYGAAPFTVSSTSNSSGGSSYSVPSGPASISGNVLTLTGVGKIVVMVSQAASGNYAAASATTSFTVMPQVPTLTFSPVPAQTYGAAPFAVRASSASQGAITYTVLSGPATLSGNLVTLTGSGKVMLQASQVAAGNYAAATTTTGFTVNVPLPTVTLKLANTAVYLSALPFNVHIATENGKSPTGYVEIVDEFTVIGIYQLASFEHGNLHGVVTYPLTPGAHLLSAVYSGDKNYHSSTSAAVPVFVIQKAGRHMWLLPGDPSFEAKNSALSVAPSAVATRLARVTIVVPKPQMPAPAISRLIPGDILFPKPE